jgi:hypothetical protein
MTQDQVAGTLSFILGLQERYAQRPDDSAIQAGFMSRQFSPALTSASSGTRNW